MSAAGAGCHCRMPRSRPGCRRESGRAAVLAHRAGVAGFGCAGVPGAGAVGSATVASVSRKVRNDQTPGDVSAAVGLCKDYVHQPERTLWHDYEWGNVHWYCCGNPLEARALLDTVMQALSPRCARELRKIVNRSDAVWNLRPRPTTRAEDKDQVYGRLGYQGARRSRR